MALSHKHLNHRNLGRTHVRPREEYYNQNSGLFNFREGSKCQIYKGCHEILSIIIKLKIDMEQAITNLKRN